MDDYIRPTYNEIHNIIARSSEKIASEFAPDLVIAIGIIYVMHRLDVSLIFAQVEGSHKSLTTSMEADHLAQRLFSCSCNANFSEGSSHQAQHSYPRHWSFSVRVSTRHYRRAAR